MEQKSISNSTTNEQVNYINTEIQVLDQLKMNLQLKLKEIQASCKHDFIETAVMRKCRECKYTESVYY